MYALRKYIQSKESLECQDEREVSEKPLCSCTKLSLTVLFNDVHFNFFPLWHNSLTRVGGGRGSRQPQC
jgi:hypothetical protein